MADNLEDTNPELAELRKQKLLAEIDGIKADHRKNDAITREYSLRNETLEREVNVIRSSQTESRIYTFWGHVNESTVSQSIYDLDCWSRQAPKSDITLLFNSPGGNVIDGFALYDFIQHLKGLGHTITIKVYGQAASMGGVLLQAGDIRVMGANSLLMIHEISFSMLGVKLTQAEDQTAFAKRLWLRLVDILAERSTDSKQSILKKTLYKEWWLNADEALKHGFIDRIDGQIIGEDV